MSRFGRWAPAWTMTDPPKREENRDAFSAKFTGPTGETVRVRITGQALRDFGKVSDDFEEKAARTEQVLRAILETYVSEQGTPPAEIDAYDLRSLGGLKRRFLGERP